MLIEPEDGESWGPQDINNMTMDEYKKYREHIFTEISGIPPEKLATTEKIKKPPKPFHFESF